MPARAYLGLGSNLNHPPRQIKSAIQAIAKLPGTRLKCCAPWYQSIAIGPGSQPRYINTAVEIDTVLKPRALLQALQQIEQQQGRKRIVRWGPRTLDLDILLYANQALHTRRLQIPHPRLGERNFVLYPLADIAPGLNLPDGTSLASLLAKSSPAGIVRLNAGGSGGRAG
ncbi:MAG: 2-amino-4-hydroxy-6-hydroxymethyldihydropteridine diphosphokinase [Gammaproteobacteria bacterium]|nr:2-amino-4-hydroxy-6-hydroxymethyldihydropteridine diphosphokinase [Gammaproteobacteria bacterium]MBQ0839596.1 2-amino-4-hydroxy-6-hydroxymethyldihydropteridine diphosphokinase [Gammaproteobacteria bacterium]